MDAQRIEAGEFVFHEDRRAVWRVTWTLALGFVGVAWLMQREGALPWVLFAGAAILLAGIGISALLARSKPVVGVTPEGLRVFAGDAGLAGGGRGDAAAFTIPWDAVTGVGFEERVVHRRRAHEKHPMKVKPLCFRIAQPVHSPDGGRGFLERVVGRDSEMAVGEFFLWSPQQRTLDLATPPRGGFAALTAAVASAAPHLGDASAELRRGLGGPLAYAAYDAGVALSLVGAVGLWASGRGDLLANLAHHALAWGGSVGH